MSKAKRVAIIGAGYSGISVLYELWRRHKQPMEVLLFERRDQLAQGAAYSTPDPHHLLNVPAAKMSALADEPNHLVDWIKAQNFSDFTPNEDLDHQFIPRMIYGRYLSALLEEVLAQKSDDFQVEVIRGVVQDLTRDDCWQIGCDEQLYQADEVVLAMGNFAPQCVCGDLANIPAPHYIHNPWQYNEIQHIESHKDVLIIGTGLTMVDIIVTLKAKNHQGKIWALSRRGNLPQAHESFSPIEPFVDPKEGLTLRQLMRKVRKKTQQVIADGGNWRAVIDSLRPATQQLWQALTVVEKKRFLRHARAYWDVARHRIAPEIAQVVQSAMDSGQLQTIAGRLRAAEIVDDRVQCEIAKRGTQEKMTLSIDHVINAVGPSGRLSSIGDLFLDALANADYICQDDVGLGPIGAGVEHLHLHGPLTKSELWEIIAVPDIRQQTVRLVDQIMED